MPVNHGIFFFSIFQFMIVEVQNILRIFWGM